MEAATTPPEATEAVAEETQTTEVEDQRVPYERFQKANAKAKEATQKLAAMEKTVAELQAQMEERENAGLPELEQMKKRLEQAEKRAEAAEQAKQQADTLLVTSQRERLVTAAAKDQNFADPSDASAFLNLDEIEDEKDAERAVKRLAAKKPHLLKGEDKVLPGKVLADGRKADATQPVSAIDSNAEAESLRAALAQFQNNWQTLG